MYWLKYVSKAADNVKYSLFINSVILKTMEQHYHYSSVSEALNNLKKQGFVTDFNLQEDAIAKNPKQYEIKEVYRYEGNSNPDDEAVVYGIQSKSGEKGVFVSGFSANSFSEAAEALLKMQIEGKTHL